MRELLVRYLMGELDASEQRQLEARLRTSPELRAELAYLRTCMNAVNGVQGDAAEPPLGLAERTTELVSEYSGEPRTRCGSVSNFGRGRVAAFAADVDPPTGSLSWNFADFVVAAGVCLAVTMLLVPALSDSRDASRRSACQNNLMELGQRHIMYADEHNGFWAAVKEGENVGTYVVRLIYAGCATQEEMAQYLRCPGAFSDKKLAGQQFVNPLPSLPMLPTLSPGELQNVRKQMSPNYAYILGFQDGPVYCNRRNTRSSTDPLMSDAPSVNVDERLTPNHHRLLMVLFQDGHVKAMRTYTKPGENGDHLFANDEGKLAAGLSSEDYVLAPGDAVPKPTVSQVLLIQPLAP